MRDPKPHHRLDDLVRFAYFTGRGIDFAKLFPNRHGRVGEYTIGDSQLAELKSEDIANRRPDTAPFMDLNGKRRRGRYSQAIGKK